PPAGPPGRHPGPGTRRSSRVPRREDTGRRHGDHHGGWFGLEGRGRIPQADGTHHMTARVHGVRRREWEETVSGGWVEKAGEILDVSRVPYEKRDRKSTRLNSSHDQIS